MQANDSRNRSEWMELNDSETSVARCHEEKEVTNNQKNISLSIVEATHNLLAVHMWTNPRSTLPLLTPETTEHTEGANTDFAIFSRVT